VAAHLAGMHLVRGSYGQPHGGHRGAAGAAGASSSSSSSSVAAIGGYDGGPASARLHGARGLQAERLVSDPDDVDDLLQRVRHASAIQNASAIHDSRQPLVPSSRAPVQATPRGDSSKVRPLSRSLSEATWDRPKTREHEEEDRPHRALPKATVRGRYVFSGGAEAQVLAPRPGRSGPEESCLGLTEFASQFSPRPARDEDHHHSPGRLRVAHPAGRAVPGGAVSHGGDPAGRRQQSPIAEAREEIVDYGSML